MSEAAVEKSLIPEDPEDLKLITLARSAAVPAYGILTGVPTPGPPSGYPIWSCRRSSSPSPWRSHLAPQGSKPPLSREQRRTRATSMLCEISRNRPQPFGTWAFAAR